MSAPLDEQDAMNLSEVEGGGETEREDFLFTCCCKGFRRDGAKKNADRHPRLARPLRSPDAKGPNFHAKESEERRAPFARYEYAMENRNLLSVLEKRVREVEQLAADCILDGDVMRLEQSVAQYRQKARVPISKRVKVWPPASRRTASFGWPRG